MNQFYTTHETPELNILLKKAVDLKARIEQLQPLARDIWETIQEKLRLDWTYNSTSIEGNTLSRGETAFFLNEGLTVQGKPLKDFLEVKNHHEAIAFLSEVLEGKKPVTEGLLKDINALLMRGIDHTASINQHGQKARKPVTPGQYKRHPNHVLQLDGTVHYYTDPLQVRGEMEYLCRWIDQNIESQHPIITGAIAHYNLVRIHPFDDGNGRGARMLMNLILMKKAYPPAVIRNENRQAYLESLIQADRGNLSTFIELITKSLLDTQEIIINELENGIKSKTN